MLIEIGIGLLLGIIGAIVGFFSGKAIIKKMMEEETTKATEKAQQVVEEAKKSGDFVKKEEILKGKEEARKIRINSEKQANIARKKQDDFERKFRQKEAAFNQRSAKLKQRENEMNKLKENLSKQLKVVSSKQEELNKQQEQVEHKRKEIEGIKNNLKAEFQKELEKLANITEEEAKKQLIATIVDKAETEAMAQIKEIVANTKLKANKEAKKIIIQTIQRTAAEHTIENTVSVFRLESDDVKGQIIGREGRNIRALEAATGVEIIVDDTPEAIVISGYDPVRREIARLSLQRLVTDGRIHPARIEEIVAKTRKQLQQQIVEIGERTVIDLNIHGMHPELIKAVGRMRFRSSYGQNLLQHSIETAKICSVMAAELGLGQSTVKLAKRAGLLHDIGKVPEDDTELSHALLGMKLTERFKEHPAVCNAVGAHHDEVEMTYIISPIVQAGDAISGARPGARREILESYLKRIAELETLAKAYEGVEKAYAIQAGRELRVIVESDKIADDKAEELSYQISQKIQTEMQYPGQIKVTVIREKRAISYAR